MIDWRHWHNEPWLIGGLVFLGWLWAVLAGPLRARRSRLDSRLSSPPFPRAQAARFYAGLLIFYVAVGSPLDQVGERFLFSAHMLQHQLLVYPAAVLFLLGIPHWMIDGAVSQPVVRALLRLLTQPVVAVIFFTLVIGTWHAPFLYEPALHNKALHVTEHITFFIAALVFWWPILSPSKVLPPLPYGSQMLYVLGGVITMTPVFAFITFSHDILYPTYEFAPRLFATFSPANDQLLAGVSMQLVGVAVAMLAFGRAFYRWYEEKK